MTNKWTTRFSVSEMVLDGRNAARYIDILGVEIKEGLSCEWDMMTEGA